MDARIAWGAEQEVAIDARAEARRRETGMEHMMRQTGQEAWEVQILRTQVSQLKGEKISVRTLLGGDPGPSEDSWGCWVGE